MKAYILDFTNPSMEAEFQQERLIGIQKPMYTSLLVAALGYHAVGVSQTLVLTNIDDAKIDLAIGLMLLVQLIIVLRDESTIRINQIVTMYISMLTQLDTSRAVTIQDYYLYGGNVQIYQACVVIMCDFKHAIHMVICSTATRLIITLNWQVTADYRDTGGAIVLNVVFLAIVYFNDKKQRTQYLLNKKDLRWLQYIPSMIQRPYFIMEYSQKTLQFKSIEQHVFDQLPTMDNNDNTMKAFIRSAQIEKISLELYIYRNYVNLQKGNTVLNVIYQRKHITVEIFDLNIQYNQYLLIVNIPKTQTYQADLRKHVEQYAKFISANKKLIISCRCRKSDTQNRKQLKQTIINNLFLSSMIRFSKSIQEVNFSNFIMKMSHLYCQAFKQKVSVQQCVNIRISTQSQQLFAFINHLFLMIHQQYENQSQISISIYRTSEIVILKLDMPFKQIFLEEYQKSTILIELEQFLLLKPVNTELEFKFPNQLGIRY